MRRYENMYSWIITLQGHYASPICKYTECQTPLHWELLDQFNSIDELLSESANTKIVSRTYVKDKERSSSNAKKHFTGEYIYTKSIARNDVSMALGDPFYIYAALIEGGERHINPLIAINIMGEKKDVIYSVIEQLEGYAPGKYPNSKFIKNRLLTIEGIDGFFGEKLEDALKKYSKDRMKNLIVNTINGH